ncbi:hypothetical protein KPSA1_04161 [Pseudomonas syringae pv. actinidiae]|uniref:Uncharacterized protein n=1 Tax=Pseudomonas syringae pv. actinidiae TaxID=103796 RepID=A0A2V0QJB0_PSESF|nr:hypothetical protein KPSA1_04161 [Pseudomonas syringae pv. actinidiae]
MIVRFIRPHNNLVIREGYRHASFNSHDFLHLSFNRPKNSSRRALSAPSFTNKPGNNSFACCGLRINTPSSSPIAMSPGFTTTPPISTGPLSSPLSPRLRVVTALMPWLKTGRRCSRKAATSVTAPDTTTPARPLMRPARVRSSPQQAQCSSPTHSITSTSPGRLLSSASRRILPSGRWTLTVTTLPTSRAPSNKGLMPRR